MGESPKASALRKHTHTAHPNHVASLHVVWSCGVQEFSLQSVSWRDLTGMGSVRVHHPLNCAGVDTWKHTKMAGYTQ